MAADRPTMLGAVSIRGGFLLAVYNAKQAGSSSGLRDLSSLRSCGDFLCAKGTVICCHLLQIPYSPEFLKDILDKTIPLSAFLLTG